MRIAWMTWKDAEHPRAGGAEAVNEALAARLAARGHEVTFVVAGFSGAAPEARRDGFRVVRVGGRLGVYPRAWRHYRAALRGNVDVVVDEMNTLPFFARWYAKEPTVLFAHQLARAVWLHELPGPLGALGWAIEPLYVRALSRQRAVTVSESTKRDLVRHGFRADDVTVIPQISRVPAAASLPRKAWGRPTLLAFGSVRAMKRTLHVLRAFEIAKRALPELKLVIAGPDDGPYGARVRDAVAASAYAESIRMLGAVPSEDVARVLHEAHVLCAASVKEGWGLVVTEAAGQGTPAVAYDVDGLRDSVRDDETGVLVPDGDAEAFADAVVSLLRDPERYDRLRAEGWRRAAALDADESAARFERALNDVCRS